MARLLSRVDLRDVAYTGAAAGLLFIGFEMVATASLTGPATALIPLRMIGTIVLGRAALDPNYSIVVAGLTGLAVHLLLSIAFAALFAEIVTRIERATEGELMATNGQLVLAGTMFGTALWLVNFYVIAPLAGWTVRRKRPPHRCVPRTRVLLRLPARLDVQPCRWPDIRSRAVTTNSTFPTLTRSTTILPHSTLSE